MGKYINVNSKGEPLPAKGKAQFLVDDGAELLTVIPEVWEENLVCVADNGAFEAAAYAFDDKEFRYFLGLQRGGEEKRPTIWLRYPHAKQVAR